MNGLKKKNEKSGLVYNIKGQKLDVHAVGVRKNQKMKNWDEIGQIFGCRALDDTKKMRKAGADTFARSGPEKNPKQSDKYLDVLQDFPRFVQWT